MQKIKHIIEAPNFHALKKIHQNKWVAFSTDYQSVVASAGSLKKLKQKAVGQKVVVMKVLPFGVGYAPQLHL